MINQMVELHEKNPHIVYILIAVVLYLLYRYYLKGITFKVDPCHDVRAKNIGKPLPAYPNGWYVAIRS
jgi:hypothetical protein